MIAFISFLSIFAATKQSFIKLNKNNMKRTLLLLIVLFTLGEMTRAQALLSTTALPADTTAATVVKAPCLADAETVGTPYWVAAKAYYNEYYQFDTSSLTTVNYQTSVTIDGTDAAIDGLVDMAFYTVKSSNTIHGVYDAKAKTITVSTPSYDSSKKYSSYTQLANITYYGSNMAVVLFAGQMVWDEEEQQYGLETVDELVFDVSDDLKTLTPRTGYGAYGFYTYNGSNGGFVNFFKTSTWMQMTAEAHLLIQPDTLTLSGPAVTVGAHVSKEFTLSNIGNTETDYTCNVVGDGLLVYASRSIGAATSSTYKLVFTPAQEGNFSGTVEFVANNGSRAKMAVQATVGAAPDFSKIVKEGDITFSFADDYPFVVTDTIAAVGKPAAVSTNENVDASSSTLLCNVSVPEGKSGVLSWKGTSVSMSPCGVYITLDDEAVYDNIYTYSGLLGYDDISNTLILQSGAHTVSFVNEAMRNHYVLGYSSEPLRTYLYDFSLQLVDKTDNAALLKDETINFGRHYVDKFAATDTLTVRLVNLGNEPLQVTGFDGGDNFTGVLDGASAAYTEELPVRLTFTASELGDYDGNVVIQTNAGEFAVGCKASAERIVYDYSPIVSEGEFSFNTSFDYPFYVQGDSAYSSIAYITAPAPKSWLEASFEVPEGKEGVLTWDGDNSSAEGFNFMGKTQHNDGTTITIDGINAQDFDGEVDAGSANFTLADRTFSAGRHTIRFFYQKIYSVPSYLDRFLLRHLGLHLQESTAISKTEANSSVRMTEIYGVSGERRQQLRRGINIVRTTMTDGTIRTKKVSIR